MGSKSDELARQLVLLDQTRVVVCACRVPGELNSADGPSRDNLPNVTGLVTFDRVASWHGKWNPA
jgi:hypothetical protein